MGQGLIVGQPAWLQRKIHLRPQHRGVHLVTEEILRQVCYFISGLILPFPVGKAQMQIPAIFIREIATATSFSVKLKQ